MKGIKIIAQILLLLILIVFGIAYLAGFSVSTTVLSRSYYNDLFQEKKFAQVIYEDIMAELPQIAWEDAIDVYMPEMGTAAEQIMLKRIDYFMEAFTSTIDSEMVKTQLLDSIDYSLAFMNGTKQELPAVIRVGEIKEQIESNFVEELQSLSDQKLQEISIERRDIEAIASQFVEMIDLPDVINLNEVLEEAGNEQQFQDVVTGIQVFKRMLNIVPTIVFTLILIGFCLLGRIQGGLTWFGAGIMTSGLLFLGALYAFKSVLFEAVGSGIGRISQGIAIEHASIVSLVNYTVGRMSPMPIIFIILGIASIAAAFVIKHKQGKQEIYGTNADM